MGKKFKDTREEQRMISEMKKLENEVRKDSDIVKTPVPFGLWNELLRDIREYEEEKKVKEQAERDKELIRLGLVYERKRKYRKYYVLAATLIMVLAFGITSFGGAEKLFYNIKTMISGREQEVVDSEGMVPNTYVSEDEVYEEIEDQFGVCPVKLNYLPSGSEFLESTIIDNINGIQMIYGKPGITNILYYIRPNYNEGSLARDIEDKIIFEHKVDVDGVSLAVKKYQIEDGTYRWSAQFEHRDVSYFILAIGIEEEEFDKIIDNLYFN